MRSSADPQTRVHVDFSYRATSTLGWIGMIKNLSPDFTLWDPERTKRFDEALAEAICSKTDEINRLIQPRTTPHPPAKQPIENPRTDPAPP